MTQAIILLTVVLFVVAMFLLYRVQVLAGILKGPEDDRENATNNWMGIMLFAFFIIGIGAMFFYGVKYWDDMIIPTASEHAVGLESSFWVSMGFIIVAMVFTNFLLMYFAFAYRFKKSRKAKFYPDNHKLELVWTVIPAAVLSVLIFTGWRDWSGVMDKAPSDAMVVEIRGEQFAWQARYPGADKVLGKVDYRRIDPTNQFGLLCEDPASKDDFFAREIHLPVGKPVLFKIRARDVLHSVFAPHFRVKMDAVPGMPTKFWFTPTVTTKEMNKQLTEQSQLPKNPDGSTKPFRYELVCAEVCGKGHFNMKKIIVVETEEEYQAWLKEQKSFMGENPEVCGGPVMPEEPAVEVKPEENIEAGQEGEEMNPEEVNPEVGDATPEMVEVKPEVEVNEPAVEE